MPFDPDAFLAASTPAGSAKPFDPDEFLKATEPATGEPKPFDPDAFLENTTGTGRSYANLAKRGALSEGLWMAEQGLAELPRTVTTGLTAGVAKMGELQRRVREAGIPIAAPQQETVDTIRGLAQQIADKNSPAGQLLGQVNPQIGAGDWLAEATQETRNRYRADNPVRPDVAASLSGQIVQGVGQAIPTMAAAAATGGGAVIPMALGQINQEALDDARQKGGSEYDARTAATAYLPAAALESFGDLQAVKKILKPLVGKVTIGKAIKEIAQQVAIEGGTEGAQQVWLNAVEKAGFKPDQELTDQVLDSFLVGGAVGGLTTATGMASSEGAERMANAQQRAALARLAGGDANAAFQRSLAADNARRGVPEPIAEQTLPAAGTGTPQPSGAMADGAEAVPTAGTTPAADPVAEIMAQLQAEAEATRAKAAAAEADRAQRQAELQARREAVAGHLERAEQMLASEAPSGAAVQGAATTLDDYLADNSLKLPPDQRARLDRVNMELGRRLDTLRSAEETRRAQAQAEAKAAAEQQTADTKARVAAEKAAIAQQERTGRDATGKIVSLSRLPLEELQRIDELQDYEAEGLTARQVETELRRRLQAEERQAATASEAGNDLLSALRAVKLPNRDSALGTELEQLIGEGMTVAERKRYVNIHRSGGLDSVAEQLREDHGFTQIQTPADVIDHVQRALRGEQVLPARRIEFATPAGRTEESAPMASGDGAAQQSPQTSPPSGQGAKPLFGENNRLSQINRSGAVWRKILEENPDFNPTSPTATVYRAAIGSDLRPNDFVALTRGIAEAHLENLKDRGETGQVRKYEVAIADLLMANDATEFVYFPRPESSRAEGGAKVEFSQQSTADRYRAEVRRSLAKGAPWTGAPLDLGIAAEPLRLAGLPAAPIRMDRAILTKAMTEKHPFSANKFLELPERLQNPIAVFSSSTPGDYVVLTEIREAGHSFVVPLEVTADKAGITINRVKSVYPKDGTPNRSGERVILDWIQNGQTRYYNRQKLQSWMSTLRSGLLLPTAPTTSSLQNVPSDAAVRQVQFAAFSTSRPAQARLSEARKEGIWRRLQTMLPELTKQVDIKIALTRRAYREALNGEIGPGQGRGSEAVAIPANYRQAVEAAEAERNAIIFAAEAWTTDRKGIKRLLHEVAHIFYWTLPRETQAALKQEYARQLAAAKALQEHFSGGTQLEAEALARAQREVGPLWDAQGRINSDLDGVEDGDDHGLREWFAELTMWRNRQWALRRYVQAGTLSGRLRMMIDDAADGLRELVRRVARAFVQSRGQDFAADFWDRAYRDFLANGAQWGAKQETAAVSYAKAEFARPDFATPREGADVPEKPVRSLSPEQAAAEGIGPGADPLVAVRRRIADLEAQRERMSAEGGSIAAYNHISEEIRDLQEQRRRAERSSAASVETQPEPASGEGGQAKTDAADSLAADTDASPFNAAEPEPEQAAEDTRRERELRSKRVAALEGQSAVEPAWHTRTWEKALEILRGFKGAIPELPTFPNAWWNRADPFLQDNPTFYNDVKQGFRSIQRMDGVVRREAEDRLAAIIPPLMAAARAAGKNHDPKQYQRLLELQARATHQANIGAQVPAALRQEIAALQSRIENDPYVMFSRLVMYLDLQWRAQNLKTADGRPITLPMGLTEQDVAARLAEIRQRIAASGQAQEVATALRAHTELVAQVAQDLETRELFPQDTLRNPYYFPHLVLNQTAHDKSTGKVIQRERELRLEKVTVDTGEAFRGYLLDPVGSDRPIETDYLKAMFYHLVQVGAHNAMADARDQWFKPYDIRNEVAARAKQLARQRGISVSWRQAFEEEFKARGYVLMSADLGRNLMPAVTIDRDRLAQRLGAAIGEGDLQSELAKLGVKGIQILPEDVKESLMAGEKEYWVVPARVADALQGIKRRNEAQDNAIEKTMGMAVGLWKRWMLFAPHNWMRYEFNNRVADLEKLFSADPVAFRYLPRAFREVQTFFDGRDQAKITPEVRAAFRHGVVGGITAEEIGKLPELNQLSDLATDKQRLFAWLRNRNNTAFSRLDESAFRYAKFLADLERIRAGARPVYAGAYHADIDHILEGNRPEAQALQREIDALRQTIEERRQKSAAQHGAARDDMIEANARAGSRLAETERRLAALPDSRPELAAAEISNKTFGDYGDITVNGAWLRKKLAPFWSWTEVNFKYHANLFRNMRDAVAAGDQSAAAAAKAGARAAAVFGFQLTRKGAALFLTRLALPYIAVAMWNNGDDDRKKMEEELSEEDRRRFHIIVGRTDDGKPEVIYFPTAFSDISKWFGGPDAARLTTEWLKGQTTLGTAVDEWTQRLVPDALNNIVGQIGPAAKIPYVLASHKNPFPDVTDQRSIPAYDFRRAVIAQATDQFTASLIERAINSDFVDPRTMGDWASQLILQVRRRDPESWAFYAIKDKAENFVQQQTGRLRDPGAYDAPEAQVLRQFRRAIYQGDVETAARMYDRLLGYGYTADRFKASIRAQHPLAGVPTQLRDDFLHSLSPYERSMLERAMRYYTRMGSMKDSASRLFPKAGKTARQNDIYQRMFTPHPERLQDEIDSRESLSEDEIDRQARRQLEASLR